MLKPFMYESNERILSFRKAGLENMLNSAQTKINLREILGKIQEAEEARNYLNGLIDALYAVGFYPEYNWESHQNRWFFPTVKEAKRHKKHFM